MSVLVWEDTSKVAALGQHPSPFVLRALLWVV